MKKSKLAKEALKELQEIAQRIKELGQLCSKAKGEFQEVAKEHLKVRRNQIGELHSKFFFLGGK